MIILEKNIYENNKKPKLHYYFRILKNGNYIGELRINRSYGRMTINRILKLFIDK